MVHVKNSEGKKDRYVTLADILMRGLQAYLESEQPNEWVFNSKDQEIKGRVGGDFDSRYSQRGVQWAVNEAKEKAGTLKPMNVYTLISRYRDDPSVGRRIGYPYDQRSTWTRIH